MTSEHTLLLHRIADSNAWIERHYKTYWTGWRIHPITGKLGGQFLWKGTATFKTGRVEEIYYYVNVCVDQAMCDWVDHIHRAADTVEKFKMAPFVAGILMHWKNGRKARPVQEVEWLDWQQQR